MTSAMIYHPAFRTASMVVLALVAVGAVYLAARAQWPQALALAGLLALGIGFVATRDRLPAIFNFLFVLAAAINMAGYVFTLWHDPIWFDEVVHAYTSFAIAAAIGWLLIRKTRLEEGEHSWQLVVVIVAIGILLGILWEVFEWAIGIIGTPFDTRRDLVMDALGAVAAGLCCVWVVQRRRR